MIDISPALASFLKEEYDRCHDETLEEERENAIDRYNGEPYGDEVDGASQVVARDTSEVIDYMVISVMRTIISGERVVEFVHRDTAKAHEATETIMHLLMDEQDGYQMLHDWLKSGLLEKTAVAMTFAEQQPAKRRTMEGVSEIALAFAQEQGVNIIEAEQTGEGPEGAVYTVAALEEQQPKFLDAAVPNEEFYCSPDARNVMEAAIKGRRIRKSLSDLVEMGFPREEVEAISTDDYFDNEVQQARDEDRWDGVAARSGMARNVWWHEEYVRFDANDDGVAELLFVQRTADHKVFSVEEVEDEDDCPFVEWCPFPMPHRRIGQSLSDKVIDIERINTILTRQWLDGVYLANNPSTYVHEDSIGENTIEDLLTVRAGRLVRWRGSQKPEERSGNFDFRAGSDMLEWMARQRESRTGITRLNQGLDEDTLNQTASGQAQLIARGEQVEEYVARNFGNAVAKLITKKARLLRQHGKPIMVPIDGQYRQVDPSQWPEDMIARARVGLGASRKETRMALRRELLQYQMAAMQNGLSLVDESKLYNSMKGFVADATLGDVGEYFNEPPVGPDGRPIPQQPQPDPEMMKVQAQAQAKQQELQLKVQAKQQELQLKMAEMQQKGQMDAQIQAFKVQQEASIARYRAAEEARLAREKAAMEAQTKANLTDYRAGGSLAS